MTNPSIGNPVGLIRWTDFKKTAFEHARKTLAVVSLLLMMVNSGWAQEVDSSVLQAQAAAHNAHKDSTAASPQVAPAQASSPQPSAPRAPAPQTSPSQQTSQPQT